MKNSIRVRLFKRRQFGTALASRVGAPLAIVGLCVASCSTAPPPKGEPVPPPSQKFPPSAAPGPAASENGRTGEWTGQVATGLMAIGGETTGITLTTETDVFELRATGALLDQLRAANGQRLTVRGVRRDVAGVERRQGRRLIDVTAIER